MQLDNERFHVRGGFPYVGVEGHQNAHLDDDRNRGHNDEYNQQGFHV
jgi:hypothetical protein